MFWGWRGSSRPRYREPSPVETQGAATMKRLTLGLLVSALLVAGPAAAQTPLAMAGLTITSFQTPPGSRHDAAAGDPDPPAPAGPAAVHDAGEPRAGALRRLRPLRPSRPRRPCRSRPTRRWDS
jgi:hypothetical protein